MATVVISPSSDDVTIRKDGSYAWNSSQLGDGSVGTTVNSNSEQALCVRCDVISASGTFNSRAFLYFDTSTIPASAVVTNAVLSLRCPDTRLVNGGANEYLDARIWPVNIIEGTFPVGTLSTGNFGSTIRANVMGSEASNYFVGSGVRGCDITFNGIGRGRINKGGLTKLVIIGNYDQSYTIPGGSMQNKAFEFYSQNYSVAGFRPLLTIDYQFPPYPVSQMV